jgi:hypothetical protein
MKAIIPIFLLLALTPTAARSQSGKNWITLSPQEERFAIAFPAQPTVKKVKQGYGPLTVEGRSYTSQIDGVVLKLWSFPNSDYSATLNNAEDWLHYRDALANLVRETLLKPLRTGTTKDQFHQQPTITAGLYDQAFSGREYHFTFGQKDGLAQIFVGTGRIYVLAVIHGRCTSA